MELIKEFADERLRDKDFADEDEISNDSDDYELFQKYITLRSALMFACKGGQIEIVKYLAEGALIPVSHTKIIIGRFKDLIFRPTYAWWILQHGMVI